MRMVESIDEETVDLIPTFDGSGEEPLVMPTRFPNLLVNGSQGIAVGMATNIPTHNLTEIIDATLHLIDNPDATVADLMEFVRVPIFQPGDSLWDGLVPMMPSQLIAVRFEYEPRRNSRRWTQHSDCGH